MCATPPTIVANRSPDGLTASADAHPGCATVVTLFYIIKNSLGRDADGRIAVARGVEHPVRHKTGRAGHGIQVVGCTFQG